MNGNKILIYDIEVFCNFFSCVTKDYITKQLKVFTINEFKDDSLSFVKYILDSSYMVGFNNINYDYQIIHVLIDLYKEKKLEYLNSLEICKILKKINDDIIVHKTHKSIYSNQFYINQIDLYKIWHFDNKSKRMSLKDFQVAANFKDIEEYDDFDNPVLSENIKDVIKYNINDVKATEELFLYTIGKTDNVLYKDKNKLKFRKDLIKKFNLSYDSYNYNDPKLGYEIIMNYILEKSILSLDEIKNKIEKPKIIEVKDLLFEIDFLLPEFKTVYEYYKNSKIFINYEKNKTSSVKKEIVINNMKYSFGKGGIHGAINGVYESNENSVIKTIDVASLYPSFAIENSLYPKSIGFIFVDIYKGIREERFQAKNLKNDTVSDGLKLSLNGTYGNTNNIYSLLFDPYYTYKTTINCQFLIFQLCELLVLENFKIIMVNTDGLECIVPIDKINQFQNICKNWEKKHKLILEENEYEKIIIRDVNNYIAYYKDKSKLPKTKGCFEIDKELHKNHSMRIVRIALYNYYTHKIPIKETIKNHLKNINNPNNTFKNNGIFDFCKSVKKSSQVKEFRLKTFEDGKIKYEKLKKTVRYFISNDKYQILEKVLYPIKSEKSNKNAEMPTLFDIDEFKIEKNRIQQLEVNYNCRIFNFYKDLNFENLINYSYYNNEANKIKEACEKS